MALFFIYFYLLPGLIHTSNTQQLQSKPNAMYTSTVKIKEFEIDNDGFRPPTTTGSLKIGETCDPQSLVTQCGGGADLTCKKLETDIIFGNEILPMNSFYCLPPKRNPSLTCTSQRGGKWLIAYNNKRLESELVCRCTMPHIFINTEMYNDCDHVAICNSPVPETTTSIESLKCNCDNYQTFIPYVTGGDGPYCRNDDFFQSASDPETYNAYEKLSAQFIDKDYIRMFPKNRSFPNPCTYDFVSGNIFPIKVAEIFIDTNNGVVQCRVLEDFLGRVMPVISSTDYLDKNNGNAPNGVVQVTYSLGEPQKVGFEIGTPNPNNKTNLIFPIRFYQMNRLAFLERLRSLLPHRFPLNSTQLYLRVFLPLALNAHENTNFFLLSQHILDKVPQIYGLQGYYQKFPGINSYVLSIAFCGWTLVNTQIKNINNFHYVGNLKCIAYEERTNGDVLGKYQVYQELNNYITQHIDECNEVCTNLSTHLKNNFVKFHNLFANRLMFTTIDPSTNNVIVLLNTGRPGYTGTFILQSDYLVPAYNNNYIDNRAAALERPEFTKYTLPDENNVTGKIVNQNGYYNLMAEGTFNGNKLMFYPIDWTNAPNWPLYLEGPFNNYTIPTNDPYSVTLENQPYPPVIANL